MPDIVFEHAHRTAFGVLAQRAHRADQVAAVELVVAGDEQGRHVVLARPFDRTGRAMQVPGQHQHIGIDRRR